MCAGRMDRKRVKNDWTMKNCWPRESDNIYLEKMNRRIEHLTGLNANAFKNFSEPFMVNLAFRFILKNVKAFFVLISSQWAPHEITHFYISVWKLWNRWPLFYPSRLSPSFTTTLQPRINRK